MIGDAMYTTIKTLSGRGQNISQIAKATGHDWKTVKEVIRKLKAGQEYPLQQIREKKINKHKEQILEWIEEGLSGLRIHEKILGMGEQISYSSVKNYLVDLKGNQNIFMRLHSQPGEEAQVDFGYVGITLDNLGKKRKTWVFNMKLSCSRYDFYEKVYDQKVETFIRCHINAFEYFGGIPEYVKIDNLKAAILEASFYEPIYQELYKQFSEHCGFKPLPCRIYTPNDKGKVESGIKYVKNNFFAGRVFIDGNDLDKQLRYWLDNTCNVRVHGTTKQIPREVFEAEEKPKLINLPLQPFNMSKVGTRKVQIDCHIYVEHNYYSVPFEFVGREVEIELSHNLLKVIYRHKQIALHTKLEGRGKFSTINEHYPKYKVMSATELQEKFQVKMSQIGIYAEKIFFLAKKNQPNYWYKTVKGILSLVDKYTADIVELSCKRALAYEVCEYQRIKSICSSGAYALPIEFQEVNYEYSKN